LPAEQSETSVLERRIRVEAEPEVVFPFFTDPEKMVRWMGIGATLDPRPGGVFSVNVTAGYFMEGTFVEVVPYSRVVFTWGYRDFPEDPNPLPPGSSTVEVTFEAVDGATLVNLTHRIPPELHDFHVMGWDNYLPRLALAATGADPGPDPMAAVVAELES
jgi:uncharacterized protein YndB with AHSA1/START domain